MSPAQAVEAATAPLHAEIARLRAELARAERAGRDAALAELQSCLDEATVSLQGAIARVRALR